jgi:hypothetical protein
MAKKTFKLGEVCKGGIISVETKGNSYTIIAKDWDFSAGSRKSSNQSNAEEFDRKSFSGDEVNDTRNALNFLNDLTTSYHSDKIMDWVKTKVEITTNSFW